MQGAEQSWVSDQTWGELWGEGKWCWLHAASDVQQGQGLKTPLCWYPSSVSGGEHIIAHHKFFLFFIIFFFLWVWPLSCNWRFITSTRSKDFLSVSGRVKLALRFYLWFVRLSIHWQNCQILKTGNTVLFYFINCLTVAYHIYLLLLGVFLVVWE